MGYFSGTQTDHDPPEAVAVVVRVVRNSSVIFIADSIAQHLTRGTFF